MSTHNCFVLHLLILFGIWIPTALSSGISSRDFDSHPGEYVQLRAATRSSDLLKRDPQIRLTRTTELKYVNIANHESQSSIFISTVMVESERPFLVLEDIEHHIADVNCGASEIRLGFTNRDTFNMAVEVCSHLVGSYIITSHAGCNDIGARVPFMVYSISLTDDLTITLLTKESSWRSAFKTFKIDFGHSTEAHQLRDDRHQKRATPTNTALVTGIIPTAEPTATFANLDLSSKNIDTTFDLGPKALNIDAGCKNCTTTGQLKLTQGSFRLIDLKDVDFFGDDATDPGDIIQDGFVQLDMAFMAHIELKIEPTLSGNFAHSLFSVPIFGFTIPLFGKAGILFEPVLNFEWALQSGIEMSYGFELKIPEDSQVHINLANLTQSTIRGFDKSSITAVPFQANISAISLTMELALRPRIAVAFGFLSDRVVAQAGVYLDLPNINATIAQLTSATSNEKCEPRPNTPSQDVEFNKVYSNYTHISPSVGLAVGLDMLLEVDLPGPINPAKDWSTPLAQTSFPLPTACLVYKKDKDVGSFAAAEAVRKADFNDKGEKKGAAGQLSNPFSGLVQGLEVFLCVIVAFAIGFTIL